MRCRTCFHPAQAAPGRSICLWCCVQFVTRPTRGGGTPSGTTKGGAVSYETPNLTGRAVGGALARSSRIVVTKAEKGHRMFEMRPPGAPPLAPLTLAPAAPRPPPAATRPSLTTVATLARKNAHLLRDIRALTAQRDKHRDRARELPVLQKKVERLERRVVKLKKGGRRVQQQLRRVKARVDVAQLQRLVPQGDVVLLQKSLREAAEEVETLQKSLISEKAQSADVERQLTEKLQLMAEPLTARSGGAVSQHVRAAVVELAAQVNVGFRNVPKAMGVVVGLLEKLSLEQRCVEFGVTGHQMDKDTVINCCLESAELQKLYFASKVFSQTTKDDGYRGVTLRFDATSTKYEYRHLMVACIGVGDDNFDYSLSDWLCGEGAAEHSAFLSSVVRDVMDRQIMLCFHCKLGGVTYPHQYTGAGIDNTAVNPATCADFEGYRVISDTILDMITLVEEFALNGVDSAPCVDAAVALVATGRGAKAAPPTQRLLPDTSIASVPSLVAIDLPSSADLASRLHDPKPKKKAEALLHDRISTDYTSSLFVAAARAAMDCLVAVRVKDPSRVLMMEEDEADVVGAEPRDALDVLRGRILGHFSEYDDCVAPTSIGNIRWEAPVILEDKGHLKLVILDSGAVHIVNDPFVNMYSSRCGDHVICIATAEVFRTIGKLLGADKVSKTDSVATHALLRALSRRTRGGGHRDEYKGAFEQMYGETPTDVRVTFNRFVTFEKYAMMLMQRDSVGRLYLDKVVKVLAKIANDSGSADSYDAVINSLGHSEVVRDLLQDMGLFTKTFLLPLLKRLHALTFDARNILEEARLFGAVQDACGAAIRNPRGWFIDDAESTDGAKEDVLRRRLGLFEHLDLETKYPSVDYTKANKDVQEAIVQFQREGDVDVADEATGSSEAARALRAFNKKNPVAAANTLALWRTYVAERREPRVVESLVTSSWRCVAEFVDDKSLGALAATHGRALKDIVYEEVCARTAWSPIDDVDNVEPVFRDLALDKLRPVASSVARAEEIAEQLLALEPGDRHRRVASLSNDDRFQALRALQKKSHIAVQELASPDLWAEFNGAQTLSEKLQVLLADNIAGASRVGIFLSLHKSLRRELFQCALATCLESTIQKYKGDLIELVTSDEAQKILQRFGGGHRAHNRDCERGLGAALVDAARRNNKMMRASTMLALSLGRKPYVKLDNIEGSCLKGLPQRVLRQLARKVRKDAPTQKRRADAAAESALIKRQQVDNKRDTQTKAAQEKADDVAKSLSTTVKWTALPSKLPTVEVLRIQLAHNGVSPNFREKLFINFDGSVMTVPDALTPYGTAVKSKQQIVALLKLFLNDNVVAEREQRTGKSCLILSKRAAPAPAPAPVPEVSETVISDVEMAPPPAATPSPAPAAATAAAPDADAPRKRRRKAPVRTNL